MGSLNSKQGALMLCTFGGKNRSSEESMDRKEHLSPLKAQLKCLLFVRASLPLLNFPFPGSHHIYSNY